MGGLARQARAHTLIAAPHWLHGGDVDLMVAADRPTIWLCELDAATRARADAAPPIAGEALAFARWPDAGERLLRRRLARLLLARAGGCAAPAVLVEHDAAGGSDVIRPAGWHLSVAARWPVLAIAVAQMRIGVDVEAAGNDLPPDLLSPAERANGIADAGCWAAKEAHAKWSGRPRSLDPANVDTAAGDRVRSPLGVTRCWRRCWRGHHVALCAE